MWSDWELEDREREERLVYNLSIYQPLSYEQADGGLAVREGMHGHVTSSSVHLPPALVRNTIGGLSPVACRTLIKAQW